MSMHSNGLSKTERSFTNRNIGGILVARSKVDPNRRCNSVTSSYDPFDRTLPSMLKSCLACWILYILFFLCPRHKEHPEYRNYKTACRLNTHRGSHESPREQPYTRQVPTSNRSSPSLLRLSRHAGPTLRGFASPSSRLIFGLASVSL